MADEISANELLYGVPQIARYMQMKDRQIYHLKDNAGLPTFKIGRKVCANKGKLNAWLKAREDGEQTAAPAASDGLA